MGPAGYSSRTWPTTKVAVRTAPRAYFFYIQHTAGKVVIWKFQYGINQIIMIFSGLLSLKARYTPRLTPFPLGTLNNQYNAQAKPILATMYTQSRPKFLQRSA